MNTGITATVIAACLGTAIGAYTGYLAGRASSFRQTAEAFARVTSDARRDAIRRMAAYDKRWSGES